MNLRFTDDSVIIDGYVNAVERKSRTLFSRIGSFVELIRKGAFKRSLETNKNVKMLLNHDSTKELANLNNSSLELYEDSIGLHARATVKDKDFIQAARNGELVGWSFGFYDKDVEIKSDENGELLRIVKDLDLEEVSILDRSCTPAYEGTLVNVRSFNDSQKPLFYTNSFNENEENKENIEVSQGETPENNTEVDYSKWDDLLKEIKA